eukprot:scaffold225_cov388-Prasinococcus_capsulatus_cf.AAC.43
MGLCEASCRFHAPPCSPSRGTLMSGRAFRSRAPCTRRTGGGRVPECVAGTGRFRRRQHHRASEEGAEEDDAEPALLGLNLYTTASPDFFTCSSGRPSRLSRYKRRGGRPPTRRDFDGEWRRRSAVHGRRRGRARKPVTGTALAAAGVACQNGKRTAQIVRAPAKVAWAPVQFYESPGVRQRRDQEQQASLGTRP